MPSSNTNNFIASAAATVRYHWTTLADVAIGEVNWYCR